jgi:hypothetical protein
MIYSCALWEHAEELNEAQEAKLELLCRKLRLESGMKVLDIGCECGRIICFHAPGLFGREEIICGKSSCPPTEFAGDTDYPDK